MTKKLLEKENKDKDELIDEYSEIVEELSQENESQKEEISLSKTKIKKLEANLMEYQNMKEKMKKEFQVRKIIPEKEERVYHVGNRT